MHMFCSILSFIHIFIKLLSLSLLMNYICTFTDALIGQFQTKDDIHFEIIEPQSLRYTFRARPAQNFGSTFIESYSHISLIIVEPNDGCNTFINKMELYNNFGLIERGGCSFLSKCIEAERSGLIAIIIYDNDNSNDEYYIDMVDDDTKRNCSIPAAFLLGKDGHMIRRSLNANGLNRAIINIPINISVASPKRRSPPWVVW